MAVQANSTACAGGLPLAGADPIRYFQLLHGASAFIGPDSKLTSVPTAGSRKRARGDPFVTTKPSPISADQTRLLASAAASTSGQDLVNHLYRQSLEIDAIIRFQNERMRLGVEEVRNKHCKALLAAVEQQVARRMKEKEAELDAVRRRNSDLEEKVRLLAAEAQIWFNLARNSEAAVYSLRSSLEQVLLAGAGSPAREEGFGESGIADDAQSCRVAEVASASQPPPGRRCKSCGESDACVLLLPCRHLCLCRDCDPQADTCPVCRSVKNGSLHVFVC